MISKNKLKKLIQAGNSDLEIATELGKSQREIFSARKNYNLLTDEEKASISETRRKLIRSGIITLALAGVGGTTWSTIYQLTQNMDIKFIQRLQNDFHPNKLLNQ